ncbi:MAG: hypothetical protein U0169_07075 [Polyangiaceae bacterium]
MHAFSRPFLTSALASLLLATACSGSGMTAPETARNAAPARKSDMTPEEAQATLDSVRDKLFPESAKNPLQTPASLDDVEAILNLDQIDLFAAGVKFAKADKSPRGIALAAQIELSWGENLRLLAHAADEVSAELREERRAMQQAVATGKGSADQKEQLAALDTFIRNEEGLLDAASALAPVHIQEGVRMAEVLVRKAPTDYEGYRVLADYYRMVGDWNAFDVAVKDVERLRPESVGLKFVKAVALAERDQDFDGANKLLAEALAKNPKFARAQVQVFVIASGLSKKREALQALKAINPNHQLVRLVGAVYDRVFEAREKRRKRVTSYDWRSGAAVDGR